MGRKVGWQTLGVDSKVGGKLEDRFGRGGVQAKIYFREVGVEQSLDFG